MIDDFGEFPETTTGTPSTPTSPLVCDIYWMRQSTAPSKSSQHSIPSATRHRSPSNSAPSKLNTRKNALVKEDKRRKSSIRKADILKINHIQDDDVTDETTDLPGTLNPPKLPNPPNPPINKHIAPLNGVPPNSRSDGDLLAVSKQNNHIANSHSDGFLKQHEQCCTGFGTTNGKPTFNANNCVLI